ncbi:MAG: hypothetical protein LBO04_05035 [Spirochaetaceae bacterium]|jgi:hypothetical protein|nr:hypothetical protein [Spirochaetaceae bacterium]
MQHGIRRKKIARTMFYAGIVLSLSASLFLAFYFSSSTGLQLIISLLVFIIGSLCVFFAVKLRPCSLYIFFAAFLTLLGVFLLFRASGVITAGLKQSWPVLSVFSGVALLLSGSRRYDGIDSSHLIPSVALIVLGLFLLIFSLKITSFSFKQFVLDWCPVIVIMSGIMLVLFFVSGNKERM